jgi:hypothetical protein
MNRLFNHVETPVAIYILDLLLSKAKPRLEIRDRHLHKVPPDPASGNPEARTEPGNTINIKRDSSGLARNFVLLKAYMCQALSRLLGINPVKYPPPLCNCHLILEAFLFLRRVGRLAPFYRRT